MVQESKRYFDVLHKIPASGSSHYSTFHEFDDTNQELQHLIVLVHGLSGTAEDLSYLKRSLLRLHAEQERTPSCLVHLAGAVLAIAAPTRC